jgi:hypothetical protein
MLAEKVPSTPRAGADADTASQPAGAGAPLVEWTGLVAECWHALSHTSRMRAAFALAESRWLDALAAPDTHPIFTRMRDEMGAERVAKLVQVTRALTGISPVAGHSAKAEEPTNSRVEIVAAPRAQGAPE